MAAIDTKIDALVAKVEEVSTVSAGVSTVMDELIAIVRENRADPKKLDQALDKLEASRQMIAQAVIRGTAAEVAQTGGFDPSANR